MAQPTITGTGGVPYVGGHVLPAAGGAPTTNGLGTNVTSATVESGSTDAQGSILLVVSAATTANTALFTLTFATAYATRPKLAIVQESDSGTAPGNASGAYKWSGSSGTSMVVQHTASLAAGTYRIAYYGGSQS